MYTVTFYSYRGGVGRTTTLANVAADLALRGRKVLLIDFDLQAPSLTNFSPFRSPTPHPGLVEFVNDYLRTGRAPAVEDYVYQAGPIEENGGQLWVMPAGRLGEDYWQALARIDWQSLYDAHHGYLLFEDLKKQFEEYIKPEYVLIDARAGINDTTGICTRQWPDAVVMVFVPDEERPDNTGEGPCPSDFAGFWQVAQDIFAVEDEYGPGKVAFYRVACKMLRRVDEAGVFSSVLIDYWESIDYFHFSEYGECFAEIPFAPSLLLNKKVVISKDSHNQLTLEYRRLTTQLILDNCAQDRDGAQVFLKKLQKYPYMAVEVPQTDITDVGRPFKHTRRLDRIINNFSNDADVLAQAASCLFLAKRYDRALETLDHAIDLRPHDSSLVWQRASYKCRLDPSSAVDDLMRLLDTHDSQLSNDRKSKFRMRANSAAGYPDTQPLDTSDRLDFDQPEMDPYVVTAMRRLRRISTEKYEEAKQKPCFRNLSPEKQARLFKDRPVVTSDPEDPEHCKHPRDLIGEGQWKRAIASLEPQVESSNPPAPGNVIHLAMANWGDGNDTRSADLCHQANNLLPETWRLSKVSQALPLTQVASLMFWKMGNADKARELLDRLDERAGSFQKESLFSFWRYQTVSWDQFLEDCHLQRQMIKGAAIRPAFLGDGPNSG
jgi:tetratricopeptide (TPR) repeat protein